MKYEIFSDHDIGQLKLSVSNAISKGFMPAGGISVTEIHVDSDNVSETINVNTRLLYAQAVYNVNG